MSGNLLEGLTGPESQSIEAIKALLTWKGRGSDPLPSAIVLNDEVALVLSAKQTEYYTTTPKACSCPSFVYRGNPCKHQKKFFPFEAEPIADPRGQSSGKYCETDEIIGSYDGPCCA